MDSRAGLDGRKISSPPGFDTGPSSPLSVAIPTELPGPPVRRTAYPKRNYDAYFNWNVSKCACGEASRIYRPALIII